MDSWPAIVSPAASLFRAAQGAGSMGPQIVDSDYIAPFWALWALPERGTPLSCRSSVGEGHFFWGIGHRRTATDQDDRREGGHVRDKRAGKGIAKELDVDVA